MSELNDVDVSIPDVGPSPPSLDNKMRFKTLRAIAATGGLLILFIVYLCVGAAIFVAIEGREPDDVKPAGDGMTREMLIDRLMELGNDPNSTKADYEHALESYENQHGYYEYWHQWSYELSLFYCFKLITTIGYGSITPVTVLGKLVSIVYAFFGIILLLTFLTNIGSIFAKGLTSLYKRLRIKMSKKSNLDYKRENFENDQMSVEDDGAGEVEVDAADDAPQEPVEKYQDPIPFWVLTVFSIVFLLIFSACIYALEDWTYADSIYFSFMSLATIGFGDFVPEKYLFACTILIANAFVVVATVVCLGHASIMRVITGAQRLLDKVILKCFF